jgi:ribosomal-protein-alanine N-acetyltransferase
VGRFNVAGIVRGPFQSAGLGYWVDSEYAGRGVASAAVRRIVAVARDELGLHRLEASTLLHNIGSQRVLQKAGFQQIGMAPQYLQIAGKWQDHNLYQVLLHA